MKKVKVISPTPLINKKFIECARATKLNIAKRKAKKLPFKIQLNDFNFDESINRINEATNRINELIKQTKYAISKK